MEVPLEDLASCQNAGGMAGGMAGKAIRDACDDFPRSSNEFVRAVSPNHSDDAEWDTVDPNTISCAAQDWQLVLDKNMPKIENGYPANSKPLLRKAKVTILKTCILTAALGPLMPILSPGRIASRAYLGGSGKYSNEKFKD